MENNLETIINIISIKMPLIQIFIATYNRPYLVINAIHSALKQNFDSYEVIVSDNSTNDETELIISKIKDIRLLYKRRNPSLPAIDHLNAILEDVTSEYFMIFHDDDVMHPNLIHTLYSKLILQDKAVAIGSNAKVIVNNVPQKKNYYPDLKIDKIINSRNEIIKGYLLYHMVPFPSYLYKMEVAKKLRFNYDLGGKYCDATFIINLTSLGSIIFSANPLMDYYIHSGQDSSNNDFSQKNKLINYYSRTSIYHKEHPLIISFRIQNIYVEVRELIKRNKFSLRSKKNQKIINVIFKGSAFKYFPRIIHALLFNKINDKK